jgi:Ni,Fe-hydrogenase III small subunit
MAIINHCEDSQDVVIPFNIVVPANGCRPQPTNLLRLLLRSIPQLLMVARLIALQPR